MLIAHASSTCDVCLDAYTEDCSYHSIPCGHVFCLPCLVSTTPTRCPLCRHEFSSYTMRKLHLTLPSQRDLAARKLEMMLMQSSPEMTLAESLTLFQEVQDWLEGEAQDEFLILRAFAAVLCGFHEMKDKFAQSQALSKKNEAVLLQSLEEARKMPNADLANYKSKYKAAKAELAALREEYAEFHAKAEQQRKADIQAHYAHIQAQAQLQVQAQSETQPVTRRISNPLPAPPRPVEIPFLKLIETRPSSQTKSEHKEQRPVISGNTDAGVDPINSVFVPTLSTTTTTTMTNHGSSVDGRAEVTTLVFKPPKRMPVWDQPKTSYFQSETSSQIPPEPTKQPDTATHPNSYASTGDTADPPPTPPVDAVPQPESSRRADQHPSVRPVSYAGSSDWLPPALRVAPSSDALREKPRRDPQKHPRESHHIASRPISYAGWPEVQPVAADSPPVASGSRLKPRPAWQGGTGTGLRRASSPVVMHSSTIAGQLSSDKRPVVLRSHTDGIASDDPSTAETHRRHQRWPTPSPAEGPEFVLPRDIASRQSVVRTTEKTPRELKRSHRESHASHDRPHTPSSHPHTAPAGNPPQSPSPRRKRAHTNVHSYPAPPFTLSVHHARGPSSPSRLRTRELSPLRRADTPHSNSTEVQRPHAVPVGQALS